MVAPFLVPLPAAFLLAAFFGAAFLVAAFFLATIRPPLKSSANFFQRHLSTNSCLKVSPFQPSSRIGKLVTRIHNLMFRATKRTYMERCLVVVRIPKICATCFLECADDFARFASRSARVGIARMRLIASMRSRSQSRTSRAARSAPKKTSACQASLHWIRAALGRIERASMRRSTND